MKIDACISHSKVRFDQDTTAQLVISLTAPPVTLDKARPKLAIAVCLDTSGSMQGEKLKYAKMSIDKLIDHLKPGDKLSVVTFDTYPKVVVPLTAIEGKKDKLRKTVSDITANGSTNFSGGMLTAIEQLKNADLGSDHTHRVIMFTDGEPNAGVAKTPADIIKFFKANSPDYISASAFGYGKGEGDFKPAFLADFAREANGNYAHVENPDSALKAFGTELGGLISTYATGLRLQVEALNEHKIQRVLTDVEHTVDSTTGGLVVTIPDILAEETRHLVFDLQLMKQKTGGPRSVNVVETQVSYDTFDASLHKSSNTQATRAKVQFVKEGQEDKTVNPELQTIIDMARLVRAQLDAEVQAKAGNFAQAGAIMDSMTSEFNTNGNVRLGMVAARARRSLESAASYASGQVYLQSLSRGITRGMGGSYSAEVSDDLNLLGVQLNNSSQTVTSDSFTGSTVLTNTTSGNLIVTPDDKK